MQGTFLLFAEEWIDSMHNTVQYIHTYKHVCRGTYISSVGFAQACPNNAFSYAVSCLNLLLHFPVWTLFARGFSNLHSACFHRNVLSACL